MKIIFKVITLSILTGVFALSIMAQAKRPITFDDLISIKRVGDAQISPDGRKVAYVVSQIDKDANRSKRSIWSVSVSGGGPQELIASPKNDDSPRWSRDGKYIAFLSSRDGAPQIFVADADGSNHRKVTNMPEGVADFIWSPDGRSFAYTSDVYPDCADLKCVAAKTESDEKSKVKAVTTDSLLFRHWDSFKHGKRSHLFIISAEGGDPLDLTPGNFDVPPFSLGDPPAYDFSPDSQEIVFARITDKVEAISTNNDLFTVPASGGEAKRLTGNNPGSDTTPRYSPDGRWIAYRSQARGGYEADRFRLMLYDRKSGTTKELTNGFDRWVGEILWAPDSMNIFLVAEDRGREMIGTASINGGVKPLISNSTSSGITLSGDGKTISFTRSNLAMPSEVYQANADGSGEKQLTRTNDDLLSRLDLNPGEEFEYL